MDEGESGERQDCSPIPSESPAFIHSLQVAVSVTCVLSILGASLIIVTYALYKDLRTTARQLLVNLSVADWIVAASHMLGVLTNYKRFLHHSCNDTRVSSTDTWCEIQGGFAMFSSLSSFLWTIAVAVYLFVIIVMQRRGQRLVPVFYVVCWGIPAVLTIVFGAKKYLGFEGTVDGGWCYLKRIDMGHRDGHRNVLPQIFGYDAWLYLCFLVLPVLYIWIRCNVQIKMTRVNGHRSMSLFSRVKTPDLKLIFIPLIFLLLRIWGAIVDIPSYYMSEHVREDFRKRHVVAVLIFFGAIGASAQGFCNAILFCVFTRLVRQKLLNWCRCTKRSSVDSPMVHEATTDMNSETRSLLLNGDDYDRSLPQKGTG